MTRFLKGGNYDRSDAFNRVEHIHYRADREAVWHVLESIRGGLPEDFYSIDLMDAYETLGKITGETAGEDLINEIFSKFCTGK